MKLNLAYLWEHLNMARIYTKKPGCPPDFEDPIILKRGSDVKKVCFTLHRDLPDQFKCALDLSTSTKFNPQRTFPCPQCSYIAVFKTAFKNHIKPQIITINVSILDAKGCYDYKEQYEQFKLIINNIGIALALTNLYFEH